MVAKIKKQREFDKLAFFVLTAGAILAISKIIVFVDSLDKKTMLAIHLQNLLPEHMQGNKKRLIRIFSLILELDIKNKYQKDFCNNDTRIWICTDATRIWVDIKNIVWVV